MADVNQSKAERPANLETGGGLSGLASAWRWVLNNRSGPLLIALIAYIAIIALIEPKFLSPYNIRNVMLQISVAGIVTIGMTLMIIAGQIDLSVGSLISLAACVMAALLKMDFPIVIVALSGLGLCIMAQGFVGYLVSRLKLESFIITLGFMAIYSGIALLMTNGAEIPLDRKFQWLGRGQWLQIPIPVYIFLGICVLAWLLLRHTVFGRQLFAVGENNEAAHLAGINVLRFKVQVYALHGLLVGIAAMILISRIGVGSPTLAAGLELETIAAAVIGGTALAGGRGTVFGSFLGVVFLGIISNSMNLIGVSTFWQYVMLGVVVVGAVIAGSQSKENT